VSPSTAREVSCARRRSGADAEIEGKAARAGPRAQGGEGGRFEGLENPKVAVEVDPPCVPKLPEHGHVIRRRREIAVEREEVSRVA